MRDRMLLLALVGTMLSCLCIAPVGAVQIIMAGRQVQFSESSFDKSNFNQRTAISARKQCEDALKGHLEFLEKATDLTDDQRKKLTLAGEIDIHRFFAAYESTKRGLTFGTIPRDKWQAEYAQAQKAILPLKVLYQSGLHGDTSLFAKSMNRTLQPEQRASIQAMNDARERYRYRVFIGEALSTIERKVPLTREERTKMTELLLEKTEPPRIFERGNAPIFVVLANMARIEGELEKMLAPNEWAVIQKMIQQSIRTVEPTP